MNIFISGGSGFIGQHLSRFLHKTGHSVTIGSRRPPQLSDKNDSVVYADYSDLSLLQSQDIVINLATEYGRGSDSSLGVLESNFVFPVKLLEATIKYECKAFINTDSYYSEMTGAHPLQYYNFSKKYFTEKNKHNWYGHK